MKKALLVALLSLIISTQGFSQENFLDTIWSGGIIRTFRVYIPAIYDGQTPSPLVFNFHGLGGTATAFESETQFRSVADTANFILIAPNGTINTAFPSNYGQAWNNFDCCNAVDDILFVSNLIDTLAGIYNIDTTRVYSAGYSNGGFMGYDLACKLSNRIAAIASVGGSVETSRLPSCSPVRMVPILEIHGTNDPVVAYNGGIVFGVTYLSVDTVLNFWAGNNQCTLPPSITDLPDMNPNDGSTVKWYVWPNCQEGSSVELLKVEGGGHTWPGLAGANTNRDIVADQEIWRFFLKHKLATTSGTAEEHIAMEWEVFPNPASEEITLRLPDNFIHTNDLSMTLFDLTGRACFLAALRSMEERFDVGELPPGMYLLEVRSGQGRFVKKVVVQ